METVLEPQLILVDKPASVTSHDVVAVLRGALRGDSSAKLKIGHAGTLDPFATGLLIVLIGPAVKARTEFLNSMKSYDGCIQLGTQTDTGDKDGQVISEQTVPKLTDAQIKDVLSSLTKKIVQAVPMYAAAKVAGKKLYEYARANQEPPARPIRVCVISQLTLTHYDQAKQTLNISVTCSAGTYIRTLAEQIAEALGTVGHLISLRRTASGSFSVDDAEDISHLFRSLREGSV